MNPHRNQSTSPFALLNSLLANKGLVLNLIRREVTSRYRGSSMGLLWSFIQPVLMLAVYTFVFSVIFKARWAGGSNSKTEFALVLFAGLMMFNLFAECINRSPSLILGNVNYVKKVIFPLEILPIVALGSATFHLAISLLVWLLFYLIFFGIPPLTILELPLVLLPLLLMICGLSWLLASLGVYLRDISQIITVLTTILMFLTPIFYSVTALPEQYRPLVQLSALTFVVEQARAVMLWGENISWLQWSEQMLLSGAIAWLGFAWFQKTRKGFADVI